MSGTGESRCGTCEQRLKTAREKDKPEDYQQQRGHFPERLPIEAERRTDARYEHACHGEGHCYAAGERPRPEPMCGDGRAYEDGDQRQNTG